MRKVRRVSPSLEWQKAKGYADVRDGEKARILHVYSVDDKPRWRMGKLIVSKREHASKPKDYNITFADGSFEIDNLVLSQFQVLRPAKNKKRMHSGAA